MRRGWLASGGFMAAAVVTMVFALGGEATGVVIDGFFIDDNTSIFEEDIDAIAEAGITRGCNPTGTMFCPDQSVTRGEMAAFLARALELPPSVGDHFRDDNGTLFEEDINAIAEAGITKGCNEAGTIFCPAQSITRGEMAAFLRRALELPPSATDYFTDDNGTLFEEDINSIAEAGITRGCDANRYCLFGAVSRGAMAAFIRRSLDLPAPVLQVPMSDHPEMKCPRSGNHCTLVVDVAAYRLYRVTEGVFQAMPATDAEVAEFTGISTRFTLTLDGSTLALEELTGSEEDGLTYRLWERQVSFGPGTHSLVGTWTWDGAVIQKTTVTVRAG